MSIENNKNYYKNEMLKPEGDFGEVTNVQFKFMELERLLRKGFMVNNVGIQNCQTVSEHTAAVCNLCLLVMLEYDLKLDMAKVLAMATIHEYGETVIGDITPYDNITVEEKHDAEFNAVVEITKNLKQNNFINNLWIEFEEKKTKEAKFVYDMDKLEATLNALRYKVSENIKNLEAFYTVTLELLTLEESKDVLRKAWKNYINE